MCAKQRPKTLSEVMNNLRQPIPWRHKLHLILRNNWIKIRTRSDCCGNHGEPGC